MRRLTIITLFLGFLILLGSLAASAILFVKLANFGTGVILVAIFLEIRRKNRDETT